jgi:hypothetical protein
LRTNFRPAGRSSAEPLVGQDDQGRRLALVRSEDSPLLNDSVPGCRGLEANEPSTTCAASRTRTCNTPILGYIVSHTARGGTMAGELCHLCNQPCPDHSKPCPSCGAICCSKCGTRNSSEYRFCMSCGNLMSNLVTCAYCETRIPEHAEYCPACGKSRSTLQRAADRSRTAGLACEPPPTTKTGTAREQQRNPLDMAADRDRAQTQREILRRSRSSSGAEARTPLSGRSSGSSSGLLTMEIHARELGMATGRSILANMLGERALIKCQFVAVAVINGQNRETFHAEFLKYAGSASIENLSGIDREAAQDALELIHQQAISKGWAPVTKGSHWYSYRYEATATGLLMAASPQDIDRIYRERGKSS